MKKSDILLEKNDLPFPSGVNETDDTEEDFIATEMEESVVELCENPCNSENNRLDFVEWEIPTPKINEHIKNVETICAIGLSDNKLYETCQESLETAKYDIVKWVHKVPD